MSLTSGLAQAIGAESGGVAGLKWALTGDDVNVFEEEMPTEPDTAVALYSTGGFEADSKLPFDSPTVQVVVRAGQNPQTAIDLWWAIYDYLHALRYTTLPDGTFLAWAIAQQSSPIRLGTDDNGRHRFAMNLRCEQRRASTHRP